MKIIVLGSFYILEKVTVPVFYEAVIGIRHPKNLEDPKDYRNDIFQEEELNEIMGALEPELALAINGEDWMLGNSPYEITLETLVPVKPRKDLSDIVIPLSELRMRIAQLMAAGKSELPVPNLLELVREVYRENRG